MNENWAWRRLESDEVTAEELAYMAQHFPAMRAAIANHPLTYPELLIWLRNQGDPAVAAEVDRRLYVQSLAPQAEAHTAVPYVYNLPTSAPDSRKRGMMPAVAGILVTLLALGAGGYFLSNRSSDKGAAAPVTTPTPAPSATDANPAPPAATALEYRYPAGIRTAPQQRNADSSADYLGNNRGARFEWAETNYASSITVFTFDTGETLWSLDEDLSANANPVVYENSDYILVERNDENSITGATTTSYAVEDGRELSSTNWLIHEFTNPLVGKDQVTNLLEDYIILFTFNQIALAHKSSLDDPLWRVRSAAPTEVRFLDTFIYDADSEEIIVTLTGERLDAPEGGLPLEPWNPYEVSSMDFTETSWVGSTDQQILYCDTDGMLAIYNPFTEHLRTVNLEQYGFGECYVDGLGVVQESNLLAVELGEYEGLTFLDLETLEPVRFEGTPEGSFLFAVYNKWVALRSLNGGPNSDEYLTYVFDTLEPELAGRVIAHNPETYFWFASEDGVLYFWDATTDNERFLAFDGGTNTLLWEVALPAPLIWVSPSTPFISMRDADSLLLSE